MYVTTVDASSLNRPTLSLPFNDSVSFQLEVLSEKMNANQSIRTRHILKTCCCYFHQKHLRDSRSRVEKDGGV